MFNWLRRLFPTLRLARPRTTTKRGAITETRETVAFHFHFNGAPSRQAVAPRAPAKPRHEGRLWDTLLGKKPQPLTAASVRALPVVKATVAPIVPIRALTGTAFPTRQAVADAYAIAGMQARAPRVRLPKESRPVRVKPVVVEAHTRNGQAVAAHTRKKPGTATAERTAK